MKPKITTIAENEIKSDIWDEFLSPEKKVDVVNLLKLSTDYSCQGCRL